MESEKLVSIADAQKQLSLGKTYVYQLLAEGKIPAVKIGKRTCIRSSDLNKFIEGLDAYPVNKGGIDDTC